MSRGYRKEIDMKMVNIIKKVQNERNNSRRKKFVTFKEASRLFAINPKRYLK